MVIDYLSPSKIHFVNECKLRYALTLIDVNQYGSKVFNKNTFLGILMHSVLENFLKRQCSSEDYEGLWDEMFNNMICSYRIDVKDVDTIKYHLPYYEIKKNKLKLLLEISNYNVPGYDLSLEKKITQGIVSGTADIILNNPLEKKVKIIDFKTGPIARYENAEKQEMKAGYLFQLITYGYMYWLDGYLPQNISCALQGVSESEYEEIVFSWEDYKNHERLLNGLKSDINYAFDEENLDSLATPSPNACMFCEHSTACNSLHKSINAEKNYPTLSLINQINSEFNDVESKINIITNEGRVSIYKVPATMYDSIKKSIRRGKSVFVSGLFEEEHICIKYWTRYTRLTEL